MDILKPFKEFRKKVRHSVAKSMSEDDAEYSKWVKKFETAKARVNLDIFDEREALVLGTRQVDRNINSGSVPKKGANNIYNIAFEFLESQVNSQIPQPNVRSKRKGYEAQAMTIQDSITNDLKEIGIEQVNDYNERMTPLHGYSVMMIDWDPDYKHHLYRGEIKVTSKHPKQIIPQPGVFELQKMDYFFIVSGVTKEYIKRRYDKDVEYDQQQFPEYNSLSGRAQPSSTNAPKGLTATGGGMVVNEDLVTEIVCWYRDEDGDIGKFVWVDYTVCENLPKFYYRRMMECKECGYHSPMGTDECPECESKKLKEVTREKQVLDMDITTGDGEVIAAGEEIPYFMPTLYPVIIRRNVPKSFSFEGQSDIDVIRDQQDSIKKIGTKLEEKVTKSASLLLIPDSLKAQLTSETYQIIKGNPAELQQIQVRDYNVPIAGDMEYITQQRQVAQQMLGITNSYQGLQDVTATSGRAKQIQVQQASGRLQSKLFNKVSAFKEMFERMFEFKLAFYDELRPYLSRTNDGATDYGEFDKYKFLLRDSAGELYYNTDFLFSADAGEGLPKDPMFMYEQANIQLAQGVINKVQFWTVLETLNYPNAARFKDEAIREMEAMKQNGPPPSEEQIRVQADKEKQQSQQQFDMAKQQNEHQFEIAKMNIQHNQDMETEALKLIHDTRQQELNKNPLGGV